MASGDISEDLAFPPEKENSILFLVESESNSVTQADLELEVNLLLQPPLQPPHPLIGSSTLRLLLTVEQAVRCHLCHPT